MSAGESNTTPLMPGNIFGDMTRKITNAMCTTTEIQYASRTCERSMSSCSWIRMWGVRSMSGRSLLLQSASWPSSFELEGSGGGVSGGIKIEDIRLDQVRPELNHLDAPRPSGSAVLPW